MKNDILNYYGNINAENLHSKGKVATNILLKNIDCQPNENILEFGFGTGATLVFLASIYKKTNFYGIESSSLMYKKGNARINFCFLKNIHLILNPRPLLLPYSDNFFDKVYVESVLAIQEGKNLGLIISEIYRILKPNGTFILNEGIWLDTTSKEKIDEINGFCKLKFGIIQSNGQYPYTSDWKKLIEKKGFVVEFIESIDKIEKNTKTNQPFVTKLLSKTFTFYGKLISKVNPVLNRNFSNYKREMDKLSNEEQYMDGWIINCKIVK